MKRAAVALFVLLLAHPGWGDIIEWQDASGVRHYTNLQGEVPAGQRAGAQVVVDEKLRAPERTGTAVAGNAAAAATPPAVRPEAPHEAQVVYDRSRLLEAYVQGVQRGLEMAGAGGGGGVVINGPLAVASAPAAGPAYGYGYSWPSYYPLVTTLLGPWPSRHFRPFGYMRRSVNFNPFLPRGLPRGFPRKTRVVTR